MTRRLWCERNESSASAHGHTDDCYIDTPDPRPASCARYFGSDGTLCSTHNGRFLSDTSMRCTAAMTSADTPDPRPVSPFRQVVDDLTDGCGCGCHTGIGYNSSCEHCRPVSPPSELTAHSVYPGGPPCQPNCPGEHSMYHDGYADGHEAGERYAARAASQPSDDGR